MAVSKAWMTPQSVWEFVQELGKFTLLHPLCNVSPEVYGLCFACELFIVIASFRLVLIFCVVVGL